MNLDKYSMPQDTSCHCTFAKELHQVHSKMHLMIFLLVLQIINHSKKSLNIFFRLCSLHVLHYRNLSGIRINTLAA